MRECDERAAARNASYGILMRSSDKSARTVRTLGEGNTVFKLNSGVSAIKIDGTVLAPLARLTLWPRKLCIMSRRYGNNAWALEKLLRRIDKSTLLRRQHRAIEAVTGLNR